jgi:hypothetical protein
MFKQKLNEGLRAKDLKDLVKDTFLIDTYKSKMGEDRDIAVISFRVKDRLPAIDLMEFIERGYGFVLDADISSGEESDGQYSVFVEMERNNKLGENINEIIKGISRLTDVQDWRFRYHKDWKGREFSEQAINETVPTSPESYDAFLQETKNNTVKEFLDKALYDDIQVSNDVITIYRPFTDGMKFKLKDIGAYKEVMERAGSEVKLDEQAMAETVYLNKIFGDYDIVKLGRSFMLRKENQAILIQPI